MLDEKLASKLPEDHPYFDEAWEEGGAHALGAYGKGTGLENYKIHELMDTFTDIEDLMHMHNDPDAFPVLQKRIQKLLGIPIFDPNVSEHDKSYTGDNSRFLVHPKGHRGMWDDEAVTPDGTPLRDAVTEDAQDLTWFPVTGEYEFGGRPQGNPFFGGGKLKDFFDQDQPLSHLRRKANLAERYLSKFGGETTFEELLQDEDKQADFQQWLDKYTLLDTKDTWENQILNDTAFPEGQVFRNLPMPGSSARGSGNARARLYERFGFGQPYNNEDEGEFFTMADGEPFFSAPPIQYGYKPFEGQNAKPGTLIPMDEDHGFEPRSRLAWRQDVSDLNAESDLPLTRDFNPAYIGRHYNEQFTDEQRDRLEGRMPPEEFLRSHHQMAAERFLEENPMDLSQDFENLDNPALDRLLGEMDEDESTSFQDDLRSFVAQASQNPMGAMRMLSFMEDPESLENFVNAMYTRHSSQYGGQS